MREKADIKDTIQESVESYAYIKGQQEGINHVFKFYFAFLFSYASALIWIYSTKSAEMSIDVHLFIFFINGLVAFEMMDLLGGANKTLKSNSEKLKNLKDKILKDKASFSSFLNRESIEATA
jgi:hypothetical protein